MRNNIQNNRPAAFDIEANQPDLYSNGCKKVLITTCATIGTGLTAMGSLFVLGSAGRVGPFAVKHDYATECYSSLITGQDLGCKQVDNSNSKRLTFGVAGAVLVIIGAMLAGNAVKMARNNH